MRFSPSLKSKIAFIVLLLFLGGIWLLTFLTTARLQDDFAEVLANQQFSAVSHTAAEIEQKIQSRFDLLDVVAKEITPAMLADPARLRALLANRPVLLSLFNNGVVAIAKDGLGIADYPPLPERTGSSYTGIEYFNLVMATGKPALGKPRLGRFTKQPGVGFAVPIRDESGRTAGMLAGFALLGDPSLFGTIQHANVGKTGWLAVSDARHRLIVAITDPKRIMQPFPAPGVNTMLDKFAAGYEGSGISINSQGREVLSSAKQIGKTGWFVQVVLPTDEAFQPLAGMKLRAYALAALLSALATVLAWIALRRLLKPLAAAATEIRAMAAGTRELRELPIAHQDEVGDLLASFNILFRQRHELQQELERQARTDSLTGLPNRRHFLDFATQELARTARYGGRLSVLMLDVDHFKKVNDTYGHKVGDLALQRLADICRDALREIDITARLGGEEFAVLLPETDSTHALEAAERLRTTIAAARIPLEQGLPLHFTVSIGVATLDGAATNIDTLLNRADKALYEAKRAGRNRVCAGPGMPGVPETPPAAAEPLRHDLA